MKILISIWILFFSAIHSSDGRLQLGSNINVGQSKILVTRSEYLMKAQNSDFIELELKYITKKNILWGFGINNTNIRTVRSFGAIDIALNYFQLNALVGKHLNKSNFNISIGVYLGFLNQNRVSSNNPYLDNYINSSFKKTDFGALVNLQWKICGWKKLECGINAGGTYGLNNIYNSDIYPLGGWNKKDQRVKLVNLSLGIFLHFTL
ncbi:MAG: outer membrane beta-barrel protein [Bacteroidetes bacterium]|nr:outer membrane beta-barrel protein [Bacteroidota bacterium]MBP6649588.1 outer membrane beta-barrel protein [Bacteroidia bacterium]